MLENSDVYYIKYNDILLENTNLNEIKKLTNIKYIYKKEQKDEIMGLFVVDKNNNEFKIEIYID